MAAPPAEREYEYEYEYESEHEHEYEHEHEHEHEYEHQTSTSMRLVSAVFSATCTEASRKPTGPRAHLVLRVARCGLDFRVRGAWLRAYRPRPRRPASC